MDIILFWLFLAFTVLEAFVVTIIVQMRAIETPETVLATPWLALLQIPILGLNLYGLIVIYESDYFYGVIPLVISALAVIAMVVYYLRRRKKETKEIIPLISQLFFGALFLVSLATIIFAIIGLVVGDLLF